MITSPKFVCKGNDVLWYVKNLKPYSSFISLFKDWQLFTIFPKLFKFIVSVIFA